MIVLILFHRSSSKCPHIKHGGYNDLYTYCEQYGVTLCRAPIAYFNAPNKEFIRAQFFVRNRWIWKEHIRPDMVYDKTPYAIDDSDMGIREIISKTFPFRNSLEISRILSNKWKTYLHFQEFHAYTAKVDSQDAFNSTSRQFSGITVFKGLYGSGGKEVFIAPIENFKPQSYPLLLQKYIKPGKITASDCPGSHDLRMIMRNNTPFFCYVRRPQQGELLSNISRGGSLSVLELSAVPQKVLHICHKVSAALSPYGHRFFAIDFIVDQENIPWIIEMNARPGLILEAQELPFQENIYTQFLEFLKE